MNKWDWFGAWFIVAGMITSSLDLYPMDILCMLTGAFILSFTCYFQKHWPFFFVNVVSVVSGTGISLWKYFT